MITFLYTYLLYAKELIGLAGAAIIIVGVVRACYQLVMLSVGGRANTIHQVRAQLGKSMILALEFMVGADIIITLLDPDYYNLGILASLVAIRTVLSHFLSSEIKQVI